MTEEEVYERMLGIEANIAIKYINSPETEYQDKVIKDAANINFIIENSKLF